MWGPFSASTVIPNFRTPKEEKGSARKLPLVPGAAASKVIQGQKLDVDKGLSNKLECSTKNCG